MLFFIQDSLAFTKSNAVLKPLAYRNLAYCLPIPQRSSTETCFKTSCIVLGFFIRKTPVFVYFLATLLATLAKVLVGAIPIDTGIPVHLPTFDLKSVEN